MRIVIIGNGITGITAARFIRKGTDHKITVISAESRYHYARTALMYIYMGHLRFQDTKPYEDHFWSKNRIDLIQDHVSGLNTDDQTVVLASGEQVAYDRLLLATGSRPNRFGWAGEHLGGVQGLYGLGDLTAMSDSTRDVKNAVVVGGGLIGVEMAEMLRSRGITVTFLVRESGYMDYLFGGSECDAIARAIKEHGVDLRMSSEMASIEDDGRGRVAAVVTTTGERIPAQWVGLAVGVHPNIDLAGGTSLQADRGFLVDRSFATNIPNVYAAGDCAEFRDPASGRRSVEQLWYTGRIHGRAVADALCGEEVAYEPGVFYNSAKFFDLEHQTYGHVPPADTDSIASVEWIDSDANRMVRVAYRREDQSVVGINAFGVRLRQAVCTRWIRSGATLSDVADGLRAANFDPEFSRPFETQAASTFDAGRMPRPLSRIAELFS